MEETNAASVTSVQDPASADGEAAKRRRRRGGRRHNKNKTGAPAPASGTVAPSAPAARETRPPERPAAHSTQSTRVQPPRAERGARAPKPRPAAPAPAPKEAPLPETDDSIQLISRKAPVQKYTSFEEYIKDHG